MSCLCLSCKHALRQIEATICASRLKPTGNTWGTLLKLPSGDMTQADCEHIGNDGNEAEPSGNRLVEAEA